MKHTLSFSDYMTYKKTNDKSNFDDQDEVVGTYDTLDEANAIMKNQSGGGKYVNIDGSWSADGLTSHPTTLPHIHITYPISISSKSSTHKELIMGMGFILHNWVIIIKTVLTQKI